MTDVSDPPGPVFDLAGYLARIGHGAPVLADLATLRAIHRAHAASIPYENLDIQMGLPISIELDQIFAKLVGRRRGGYCFEQNLLFFAALKSVGFDVSRRMARVTMGNDPGGRSHLMLLVRLDGGTYIADVGFGGSCLSEPLALAAGEYEGGGDRWRVRPSAWSPGWEVEIWRDGAWLGLYWFSDDPVVDMDIVFGNHFTSTHPASRFVLGRIAARVTPTERHTLLDRLYRRRVNGVLVEEVEIPDEGAYRHILRDRFLIDLPDGATLKPIDGIAR